jgi:hypothetical protein
MRCLPQTLLLALALTCGLHPARAELLFTLDQPAQSGLPGARLTFSGTLTNTGESTLFLNSNAFQVEQGLTLDDAPFLDVPESLAANQSFFGTIFFVDIDSSAEFRTHLGSFSIIGGETSTSETILSTQDFAVSVVPGPSALSTALMGATLSTFLLRRRRPLSR